MSQSIDRRPFSAVNDLATLRIDRTRKGRRLSFWLVFTIAIGVVSIVALPLIQKKLDGIEVTCAPAISVLMMKQLADDAPPQSELSAAGYVVADRQAVLAATLVGRLSKLHVKEAEEVKKDQVVAEIEHFEIDAQIAELKAQIAEQTAEIERMRRVYEQSVAEVEAAKVALATLDAQTNEMNVQWADAKRKLERDRKLAEANAVGFSEADDRETEVKMAEARLVTVRNRRREAEQQIQVRQKQAAVAEGAIAVAEARVNSTKAQVNVLESRLAEYFIRAPFDGVVTEKAAEQGEIIAPVSVGGQMARGSIVTIADWSSLQAEVDVAETFIARVKPGQRASITIDSMPGKYFGGKVQRILPRADRSKATLQVRVEFVKNGEGRVATTGERILPDMGIRVKFLPDDAPAGAETGITKPLVCVPHAALQHDGTAAFVWIAKDKKAYKRPVTPGERVGSWLEVSQGLETGEQVVIENAGLLTEDGERIQVSDQ